MYMHFVDVLLLLRSITLLLMALEQVRVDDSQKSAPSSVRRHLLAIIR